MGRSFRPLPKVLKVYQTVKSSAFCVSKESTIENCIADVDEIEVGTPT